MMMPKQSATLILSAMVLTACGGGGGGVGVASGGGSSPSLVKPTPAPSGPTSISGTVTPPVTPGAGRAYPGTNMLTPPNSVKAGSAIIQSMDYSFDPAAVLAATPVLLVAALTAKPVDTQWLSSVAITTDAAGQTARRPV